jgi:hypothetical protein
MISPESGVPPFPVPLGQTDRVEAHRELAQNPGTRSFWMTPVSSSIVILNLIAKLPLLYHKL